LWVLGFYTRCAYVEARRNKYMTSAKTKKNLNFEKISNFELE